jgi:hypothetical protein
VAGNNLHHGGYMKQHFIFQTAYESYLISLNLNLLLLFTPAIPKLQLLGVKITKGKCGISPDLNNTANN